MRLSKTVIAEREILAKSMFANGADIETVQKALMAKYDGVKMTPTRIAELYTEIQVTLRRPEPVQSEPDAKMHEAQKEYEQKVDYIRKMDMEAAQLDEDFKDPKIQKALQEAKEIQQKTGRLVIVDV